MKIRSFGALLLTAAFPFAFVACDKDDEPKPAVIEFETASEETTESDGTMESFHPLIVQGGVGREYEVVLTLDKPAPQTAVIEIALGGTAIRTGAGIPDYAIDNLTITVPKGESEVVIPLTLYEDDEFDIDEDDNLYETIVISLSSVVSGPVKLGEQTTYELRINEDDVLWFVEWIDNESETPGDINLDILYHYDGDVVWGAASNEEFEASYVPAGFPDGQYGLSYTYRAGTSDDVDFFVGMFTTGGTINGASHTFPDTPLVFEGHYTLANLNEWDLETSPPKVVQTVTKSGINYTNVSQITEPTDGSRKKLRPFTLKPELARRLKMLDRSALLNK